MINCVYLSVQSLLTIFILTVLCATGFAQKNTFDPVIKKQLDEVYKKDWQYRKYLIGIKPATKDSLAAAFKMKPENIEAHLEQLQAANDAENLRIVANIIKNNESDYPGKSLVGEPTHLVAWSVIMHSNQQQKYYPRINQAYMMGELPETAVATIEDKILANGGGVQRYGTQLTSVQYVDSLTGKKAMRWYISPVENHMEINRMRKSKGFDITIEAYAKQLGVIYDKYLTLDKLKLMREEAEK